MRRRGVLIGSVVATAAWAGCAYDWSFPAGLDPTDPDGGKGPESSKESSTSDVTRPDVEDKDAIAPPDSCKESSQCSPKQYCRFDAHDCGLSGLPGKCADPELGGCSFDRPVCTCAGKKFDSSCLATQAFQDPGPGTCEKNPTGFFLCGYLYCKNDGEFCAMQKTLSGPTKYSCESMDGCSPATCGCTAPTKYITAMPASTCSCSSDAGSAVTVACADK